MNIFEAFILGLVQGFTEFLPISSSGHMILAGQFLGIYEVPLLFSLITHVATLLAVVIVLKKQVWEVVRHPSSKPAKLIITATIPTVVIFFIFKTFFKESFSGEYLIYGFLATAILLVISSFRASRAKSKDIGYIDALIIGVAQGAAGMPGLSRSGTTISTATMIGIDKEESTKFSFLLSLPIIIGSTVFEFITGDSKMFVDILPLLVGFFTAFITGFLSIKFMLKIVGKKSLDGFAVYLLLLCVFMLLNDYILHIF